MVVTVRSLGLTGIRGYEVTVECFLSGGLPAFDMVGLPDAAVKESRERVRAAVKNCGAKFPVSRITVNLAPARVRKEGTLYDLPILLGILAAAEELKPLPEDAAFLGELSLTGALHGAVRRPSGRQDSVCPCPERRGSHAGRRPDGLRGGERLPAHRPPQRRRAYDPRAALAAEAV